MDIHKIFCRSLYREYQRAGRHHLQKQAFFPPLPATFGGLLNGLPIMIAGSLYGIYRKVLDPNLQYIGGVL
jgi:hypothetical protein